LKDELKTRQQIKADEEILAVAGDLGKFKVFIEAISGSKVAVLQFLGPKQAAGTIPAPGPISIGERPAT
jgi:hypothetical protein